MLSVCWHLVQAMVVGPADSMYLGYLFDIIINSQIRVAGSDLNTKNMEKLILFLTVIIPTNILVLLYQHDRYIIDIKKNIGNIKPMNVSDLGKDMLFIPLETTGDAMIREIRKVCIHNSYIFVCADNEILQFGRSGKFIRQIGTNGRGPEEYTFISDFCVDTNNDKLIIIAAPNRIMLFDFDGVFMNSFNLAFRPVQVLPLSGNRLIFYFYNTPESGFPSWAITDNKGNVIKTFKNSIKRISKPGFSIVQSPFYLVKDAINVMEFGTDTLYQLKDEEKNPYAIFSFGEYKMDTDPVINLSMIREVRKSPLGKMWIPKIVENKDFLFISIAVGITDIRMNAIFNKSTGALTFLKDNGFVNDLTRGTIFWPKGITADGLLIDYVDAFDLLKSVIPSELRRKLNETSNPVLMLLKPE